MRIIISLVVVLGISLSSVVSASEEDFEVFSVKDQNGWPILVRYHRGTGAVWLAFKGRYKLVKENEDLPKSEYKVIEHNLQSHWRICRIDKKTGKTWFYNGSKWEAVAEET
ncbi:hypothetical protein QP938_13445 [Porticoccaceae bacterium LTM1]|nr:hypothetical protein QP938_13445 [Porticoccaceae bacterium LTM1]